MSGSNFTNAEKNHIRDCKSNILRSKDFNDIMICIEEIEKNIPFRRYQRLAFKMAVLLVRNKEQVQRLYTKAVLTNDYFIEKDCAVVLEKYFTFWDKKIEDIKNKLRKIYPKR